MAFDRGGNTTGNSLPVVTTTTVGTSLVSLPIPSETSFVKVNDNGSAELLNATNFRTAIGSGTVTSVGGTGTVNGITLTGSVTSSGDLTLGGTLSNVNLASQVTGTLPIANGGTGVTSAGSAGNVLFSDGSSFSSTAKIVRGTTQNSTSGTSMDFIDIPSWVKRITLMLNAVSTSGSSLKIVRLGDSGGFETTGYSSVSTYLSGATDVTANDSTAGFLIESDGAAHFLSGHIVLTHMGSNLWVCSYTLTRSNVSTIVGAGSKTLSDVLTQVRLTTVNGTDAFDAGSINILYE
jgi:hypothetical protein